MNLWPHHENRNDTSFRQKADPEHHTCNLPLEKNTTTSRHDWADVFSVLEPTSIPNNLPRVAPVHIKYRHDSWQSVENVIWPNTFFRNRPNTVCQYQDRIICRNRVHIRFNIGPMSMPNVRPVWSFQYCSCKDFDWGERWHRTNRLVLVKYWHEFWATIRAYGQLWQSTGNSYMGSRPCSLCRPFRQKTKFKRLLRDVN